MTPQERPRPETFGSYRDYLAAMFAFCKKTRRGFSYRSFAKTAGFSSPGFLKHVIDGDRNLSQRSIPKVARAFKLNKKERHTFETLVHFTHAKTDEDRNHYYEQLRRHAPSGAEMVDITQAQYDAYTLWYAMPIREMLALPEFREDPEWIAARLYPPITPAQAQKAIHVLERIGLIERDENGSLRAIDTKLLAIREVQRLAVRNYHRAMLRNALSALDELEPEERNITSLTVSVTQTQYDDMCRRIMEFHQELLDVIEDQPRTPNDPDDRDVHVLAFQLFPVTKKVQTK